MTRPRDVPHPSTNKRLQLAAAAERRRKRKGVEGNKYSWLTAGDRKRARDGEPEKPPQPPVIAGLFEDLADVRKPMPIFGQFPRRFIPRILPWLRCSRARVLHLCSGALPPGEGIRVDIRPDACPDVIADARSLPFADGSHDAVMLDPPYTADYARDLYGVEYPKPVDLLREAARVVRPGGRIAFVHYLVPMPPAGCSFVTIRGLSMGFGFPMRAVTIFEKEQAALIAAPRVRRVAR